MADHLSRRIAKLEVRVSHLENPDTPGQEDDARVSPQQASAKEHKPTPGKEFPSSHVPPSKTDPTYPKDRRYKTIERWKHLSEIAGIAAAIFYAGVTYVQWRDLRHNFEVDQRSWIKIEVVVPTAVTEVMKATVTATNVGKSPALRAVVDSSYEVIESDKEPTFIPKPFRYVLSANMLFPADHPGYFVFPTPSNKDGTGRKLTSAEMEDISKGISYMAVWGQASYTDQFGEHWTRFCAWKSYQQDPHDFNARACTNYNAVGDGTPPAR